MEDVPPIELEQRDPDLHSAVNGSTKEALYDPDENSAETPPALESKPETMTSTEILSLLTKIIEGNAGKEEMDTLDFILTEMAQSQGDVRSIVAAIQSVKPRPQFVLGGHRTLEKETDPPDVAEKEKIKYQKVLSFAVDALTQGGYTKESLKLIESMPQPDEDPSQVVDKIDAYIALAEKIKAGGDFHPSDLQEILKKAENLVYEKEGILGPLYEGKIYKLKQLGEERVEPKVAGLSGEKNELVFTYKIEELLLKENLEIFSDIAKLCVSPDDVDSLLKNSIHLFLGVVKKYDEEHRTSQVKEVIKYLFEFSPSLDFKIQTANKIMHFATKDEIMGYLVEAVEAVEAEEEKGPLSLKTLQALSGLRNGIGTDLKHRFEIDEKIQALEGGHAPEGVDTPDGVDQEPKAGDLFDIKEGTAFTQKLNVLLATANSDDSIISDIARICAVPLYKNRLHVENPVQLFLSAVDTYDKKNGASLTKKTIAKLFEFSEFITDKIQTAKEVTLAGFGEEAFLYLQSATENMELKALDLETLEKLLEVLPSSIEEKGQLLDEYKDYIREKMVPLYIAVGNFEKAEEVTAAIGDPIQKKSADAAIDVARPVPTPDSDTTDVPLVKNPEQIVTADVKELILLLGLDDSGPEKDREEELIKKQFMGRQYRLFVKAVLDSSLGTKHKQELVLFIANGLVFEKGDEDSLEDAWTYMDGLEGQEGYGQVAINICEKCMSLKKFDLARKIVNTLPDTPAKTELLEEIDADEKEQADLVMVELIGICQGIPDEKDRIVSFKGIARTQVLRNTYKLFVRAIFQSQEEVIVKDRQLLMTVVVDTLIELGEQDEDYLNDAFEYTRSLTGRDEDKKRFLGKISDAFLNLGTGARAHEVKSELEKFRVSLKPTTSSETPPLTPQPVPGEVLSAEKIEEEKRIKDEIEADLDIILKNSIHIFLPLVTKYKNAGTIDKFIEVAEEKFKSEEEKKSDEFWDQLCFAFSAGSDYVLISKAVTYLTYIKDPSTQAARAEAVALNALRYGFEDITGSVLVYTSPRLTLEELKKKLEEEKKQKEEQIQTELDASRREYAIELIAWNAKVRERAGTWKKMMLSLGFESEDALSDKLNNKSSKKEPKMPPVQKSKKFIEASEEYIKAKRQKRAELLKEKETAEAIIDDRVKGEQLALVYRRIIEQAQAESEALASALDFVSQEVDGAKEKGRFKKTLEAVSGQFAKMSPRQRMYFGIALTSVTVGGVGMALGTASLGGAFLYAGYRSARAVVGSEIGTGAVTLADKYLYQKNAKKKESQVHAEYVAEVSNDPEKFKAAEEKMEKRMREAAQKKKRQGVYKAGIKIASAGAAAFTVSHYEASLLNHLPGGEQVTNLGILDNVDKHTGYRGLMSRAKGLFSPEHLDLKIPSSEIVVPASSVSGGALINNLDGAHTSPADLTTSHPLETPTTEATRLPTDTSVEASDQGAIKTFENLRAKLIDKYSEGNNVPTQYKHFVDTPSTKLAQEFGFYKPGQELNSALIHEGDHLGLNAKGDLIYEKAGGKIQDTLFEHASEGKSGGGTAHQFTEDQFKGNKMFTPQDHSDTRVAEQTFSPPPAPSLTKIQPDIPSPEAPLLQETLHTSTLPDTLARPHAPIEGSIENQIISFKPAAIFGLQHRGHYFAVEKWAGNDQIMMETQGGKLSIAQETFFHGKKTFVLDNKFQDGAQFKSIREAYVQFRGPLLPDVPTHQVIPTTFEGGRIDVVHGLGKNDNVLSVLLNGKEIAKGAVDQTNHATVTMLDGVPKRHFFFQPHTVYDRALNQATKLIHSDRTGVFNYK